MAFGPFSSVCAFALLILVHTTCGCGQWRGSGCGSGSDSGSGSSSGWGSDSGSGSSSGWGSDSGSGSSSGWGSDSGSGSSSGWGSDSGSGSSSGSGSGSSESDKRGHGGHPARQQRPKLIQPKPAPVYHLPTSGVQNNVRWSTAWSNGVCTLTCYYIVIEDGNFVLRNMKKYSISGDDQMNINNYLGKFQNSVSYPTPSPPQNGDYFTFTIKVQGGITILQMQYGYYVNGVAKAFRSKEYPLYGSWDFSSFNTFLSQFRVFTKNVSSSVTSTRTPVVSASVSWNSFRAANGQNKMKVTYVEKNDGVQVFTKSKEYTLNGETIEEKLANRDSFKQEMLRFRGHI